jgi:hypothetical protein
VLAQASRSDLEVARTLPENLARKPCQVTTQTAGNGDGVDHPVKSEVESKKRKTNGIIAGFGMRVQF